MGEVSLLADMNISPRTVEVLQRQGWSVIRVNDLLPPTATDREILELARQQARVVVTQDLDFSTLVALSHRSGPSLITLRLSATDPDTVTTRLLDILPAIAPDLAQGCAVTIEDHTVRVRRLPIL